MKKNCKVKIYRRIKKKIILAAARNDLKKIAILYIVKEEKEETLN
jgi:hypothetical protein